MWFGFLVTPAWFLTSSQSAAGLSSAIQGMVWKEKKEKGKELLRVQDCKPFRWLSLFSSSSLNQSASLLPLPLPSVTAQVGRGRLAMTRCVVGLVAGGGGRVLHDHQAYGRLAGRRRCVVRRVLLRGVLAPAVVQYAGDEKDQQKDDIAGYQDDEVEGDRVNLQVELHKTHDAASYLEPVQEKARKFASWEETGEKRQGCKEERRGDVMRGDETAARCWWRDRRMTDRQLAAEGREKTTQRGVTAMK